MRRFLRSISPMWWLFCVPAFAEVPAAALEPVIPSVAAVREAPATGIRETFFPTGAGERATYAVTLDFGRAHLTGLCIVKRLDNELVGTLLNEFGIRALDFRYDPQRGRVRLSNLLALLDSWYIRKTLRRDLSLLLQNAALEAPLQRRGRRLARLDDGTLSLTHTRRDLELRFTPLNE